MKRKKSFIHTSIAALTVLHIINKYIDSSSVSNRNKKTKGSFFQWKHGTIHYTVSENKGISKKPLLLIHDLTVFSSEYEWSQVIHQLSKEYTVYTIDLIGCGKSDKPEITYTNYFYVQMITDFVKEVIGTPTKVLVTGASSSFVLMADSIDQSLFTAITMINPKTVSSFKQMPDDRSKILIKLFRLPVIGKTAYYIAVNKQNTEYYLTEKCFYNPFHLKESVIKAYYDAAHSANGSGKNLFGSLEGNYVNIDITGALKKTEHPITMILGSHNEKREEIQNSYIKIKPDITVETVPNTKKLPHLEAPEEFLKFV